MHKIVAPWIRVINWLGVGKLISDTLRIFRIPSSSRFILVYIRLALISCFRHVYLWYVLAVLCITCVNKHIQSINQSIKKGGLYGILILQLTHLRKKMGINIMLSLLSVICFIMKHCYGHKIYHFCNGDTWNVIQKGQSLQPVSNIGFGVVKLCLYAYIMTVWKNALIFRQNSRFNLVLLLLVICHSKVQARGDM